MDWTGISRQVWRLCHFPNCLGAIDGKDLAIQAPVKSDSMYYNYKGTRSILLAVYDVNYRFILVDVGEAGQESEYCSVSKNVTWYVSLDREVGNRYFVTTANAMKVMFLKESAVSFLKFTFRHVNGNKLEKSFTNDALMMFYHINFMLTS